MKTRSVSDVPEREIGRKLTVHQAALERSRRIKREMKSQGLGLRELHSAVRARLPEKTRGASYGAVRAIVEGEVDHPRPNVLQEIASALGVRLEYLMDLRGRKTESERAAREELVPADSPDEFERYRVLFRAMDAAVLPFASEELFHEMEPALHAAATDLLQCGGKALGQYRPEQVRDAVSAIAWFWTLPLQVLRTRLVIRDDGRRWRAYWMLMSQVWSLALPDEAEGDPMTVVRHLENAQRIMKLADGLDKKIIGVKWDPNEKGGAHGE